MLHSCGWLEGGLVSSYEKFVMDADQLGVIHGLAAPFDISEKGQGLDALEEVGPGGHFLGCAHTQANFKEAFWKSEVLNYKPFETWEEEGCIRHRNVCRRTGADTTQELSATGTRQGSA